MSNLLEGMEKKCPQCDIVLIKKYNSRKYCGGCSKKIDQQHKTNYRRKNKDKVYVQEKKYRQGVKGSPRWVAVLRKQYETAIARYPLRWKARSAVNCAVKIGKLTRVKDCLCFDCGKPAKEYDHYKRYAEENWLNVQAVCIPCHKKRTIGGEK